MEQAEAYQAALQEEVPREEAPQAEEHQAEEHQVEEYQEEEPLAEDLLEEGHHPRSKPRQHNQDHNKPDHDMNPFVEQRSRNSEETEPTPRSS